MNRKPANLPARRGFTLIELMVSIALVLILILGINQVFRIASDTVNAGQALSAADRDSRAVQSVLYGDARNMVTTGAPFIVIRSQQQYAFRNLQDELSDKDFVPGTAPTSNQWPVQVSSIDIDSDGTEGEPNVNGEIIPASATNSRSHRLDQLMFFASHMFQRQTGGASRMSGSGSSKEAFVWYGHLQLANNQPVPAYYNPGEADGSTTASAETGGAVAAGARNDNNRYATQWILGRVPILLAGDTMPSGYADPYIARGTGLSPLGKGSEVQNRSGPRLQSHWSTCDVAQTSIATYREIVSDRRNWSSGEGWWDTVAGWRFWANPSPLRPLNADKISRTAPIFVQGCTQFIVEYAGDFLAQDSTPGSPTEGHITGSPTLPGGGAGDGITDFVIVQTPTGGTPPTVPVRRTRWYGMPRNVDFTDDVRTRRPTIQGGTGTSDPNAMIDVVPLRDVLQTWSGTRGRTPSIEAAFGNSTSGALQVRANYADGNPLGRYVAAWGPNELSAESGLKPTMLRITIIVDDPDGRMTEGQRYEYVLKLP